VLGVELVGVYSVEGVAGAVAPVDGDALGVGAVVEGEPEVAAVGAAFDGGVAPGDGEVAEPDAEAGEADGFKGFAGVDAAWFGEGPGAEEALEEGGGRRSGREPTRRGDSFP
jgi:hypothetical protein